MKGWRAFYFLNRGLPRTAPPQPKTYSRVTLMVRIRRNLQNDQNQMSTNDPNGRENFIKRKSFALGAPDLRLRQCHRLQPPSPRLRRTKEEADPPLAQRAEALQGADAQLWGHYHQNQCWPFSWERSFLGRDAAGCEVCFGFWIFSSGPLIGQVHPD